MQERRTALISAAVTGKIDVRNWQSPNNNNDENNMELSAWGGGDRMLTLETIFPARHYYANAKPMVGKLATSQGYNREKALYEQDVLDFVQQDPRQRVAKI